MNRENEINRGRRKEEYKMKENLRNKEVGAGRRKDIGIGGCCGLWVGVTRWGQGAREGK